MQKGDLPTRKKNRLEKFDYSQKGAYFVTICVKDRQEILSEIVSLDNNVGETCGLPCKKLILSAYGKVIEDEIKNISRYYDEIVSIANYIIMPNHIHLIIAIDSNGRPQVSPTIARVIKQFKGKITKQIGFSIWQRSYHDHIIRNEKEYDEIFNYVTLNPSIWTQDKYYK